jgi:hypothetical protein
MKSENSINDKILLKYDNIIIDKKRSDSKLSQRFNNESSILFNLQLSRCSGLRDYYVYQISTDCITKTSENCYKGLDKKCDNCGENIMSSIYHIFKNCGIINPSMSNYFYSICNMDNSLSYNCYLENLFIYLRHKLRLPRLIIHNKIEPKINNKNTTIYYR